MQAVKQAPAKEARDLHLLVSDPLLSPAARQAFLGEFGFTSMPSAGALSAKLAGMPLSELSACWREFESKAKGQKDREIASAMQDISRKTFAIAWNRAESEGNNCKLALPRATNFEYLASPSKSSNLLLLLTSDERGRRFLHGNTLFAGTVQCDDARKQCFILSPVTSNDFEAFKKDRDAAIRELGGEPDSLNVINISQGQEKVTDFMRRMEI